MKEEYATALRGHKAAVDALKCPQREAAEVYYRNVEKLTDCQSLDSSKSCQSQENGSHQWSSVF